MNFMYGHKLIGYIALLVALALVLWQVSLIYIDNDQPSFRPVDCYKFRDKQTVNEFYSKLELIESPLVRDVFNSLPKKILGKYELKYIWACTKAVYIVSYTDREIETYFDAPISIEIAFVNEYPVKTSNTSYGPGLKLIKYIETSQFIVEIFERTNDNRLSFEVYVYDIKNGVRYSLGFSKNEVTKEMDVNRALKELFGIQ